MELESGKTNTTFGNGNEAVKFHPPPLASRGISWLGVWVTVIWIVAQDLDFESDPALMRFVDLIHFCVLPLCLFHLGFFFFWLVA